MNNKKGFTLVEVLVAVLIFTLVVLIITSIISNSIRVQRYNLAHRELMDQTSYLMEYISRHIRMAKRLTLDIEAAMSNDCLDNVGDNYNLAPNRIKFIHYKHEVGGSDSFLVCTEFALIGGALYQNSIRMSDNASVVANQRLTSDSLQVQSFGINVDPLKPQPLVEINSLIIDGRENTKIEIQTSISQRDLNLY